MLKSFLSSYLFSRDGKFNFKLLKYIDQFWTKELSVDSDNNQKIQDKISKSWIPNQELINSDKKIHFLKTHSALCTINGNKFTDKYNTKAVIYIVRDPRNLITSLSHHYELSHEEALDFLTNKRKIIFPENFTNKKNKYADFNFLGDWSSHYKSWKNIKFCSIKIIKYEEILTDAENVFVSLLKFISRFTKLDLDKRKISNAINSTSFEILRKMEETENFNESTISRKTNKRIKFFNLGKKNDWQKLLKKTTAKKLEEKFKEEMQELNYL